MDYNPCLYLLTEIVLKVQRDSRCKANMIFMISIYQILFFYYKYVDVNSILCASFSSEILSMPGKGKCLIRSTIDKLFPSGVRGNNFVNFWAASIYQQNPTSILVQFICLKIDKSHRWLKEYPTFKNIPKRRYWEMCYSFPFS